MLRPTNGAHTQEITLVNASTRPAVYLVSEVAEMLKTTEWNVYQMIKRDEIPGVYRLGTKIRIVKRIFNEKMGILEPANAEG